MMKTPVTRRNILDGAVRGAALAYFATAAAPLAGPSVTRSPAPKGGTALPSEAGLGPTVILDNIHREIASKVEPRHDELGKIYHNALKDPGLSYDSETGKPVGTTTIGLTAIEVETGAILFGVNHDKPTSPASTIKTVHNMVVYDALDDGVIRLDEMVRIPESTKKPVLAEESAGRLLGYEAASVGDLIMETILKSNNQAAFALAAHIANARRRERGHAELPAEQHFEALHQEFVAMMQSKIERFGLKNTKLVNCCGYYNPRQMSTAGDLAEIARHLIAAEKYQKYAENYSHKPHHYTAYKLSGDKWKPVSKEIHTNGRIPEDPDRIKTGRTEDSGGCVITRQEREDGARVIVVVTGNKEVGPTLGSACRAAMQLADVAAPFHRGPKPETLVQESLQEIQLAHAAPVRSSGFQGPEAAL